MPTLGTQLISTSYPQLLKTFGTGGIDGTLQAITDGDDTSSALQLSTTGVSSTGSMSVTGTATVGTLKVGASGPRLTAVSYGTAAFTLSTVAAHNVADTTTGTFALTGCALGDIVLGSIDTLGAATGTICLAVSFYPQTTNVARYSIINKGSTAGTISAGTIYATAMRFTA
jgi:hypothetical protein